MKQINPDIFRAYDIRGVVNRDFDEEWVAELGRACGVWFKQKGWTRAVVGHDCRHSSPAYMQAMAEGLNSVGLDVLQLGQLPSPAFYFAAKDLGYKAGIMITASHNPPEYNGFKIWGDDGCIYNESITEILEIMQRGEFPQGNGFISRHDINEAYLEDLEPRATIHRPMKIVVDGGNGAGGELCVELLTRAGAEVIPLFCEPDGSFPNHHPDPVIDANVTALKTKVVEVGADFGVGLDGDGDRLGAVDEKGRLLFADELLAILARDVLDKKPGSIITADVKCSHRLFNDITAHGGKPQMVVTGHSLGKAAMKKHGAPLGGELSGHMFFNHNHHGYDDAPFAALLLADILSRSDKPLSEQLADWPETFHTPEIHLPCPDRIKFRVVKRATEFFSANHEAVTIDGIRLMFPDGWALVRASNTQAVLTLRFEAESSDRLAEIRKLVEPELDRIIREEDA